MILIIIKGYIHVWGLASLIPGLLEAATLFPDRRDIYQAMAGSTLGWLLDHSWNGEYFYAILNKEGEVKLPDYMIRSDAWVFNALAAATKHLGSGPWVDIAERCYLSMDVADFSGPETHASNRWKRMANKVKPKRKTK